MINDVIEVRVISLFVAAAVMMTGQVYILYIQYEVFKGSCKAVTAVSYKVTCWTFVLILYDYLINSYIQLND